MRPIHAPELLLCSFGLAFKVHAPALAHLYMVSRSGARCYPSSALRPTSANTGRGQRDGDLLRAFPLDRDRTDGETLAYVEDPDGYGHATHESPFDAFMHHRHIVCRHMRLAFEEGAHWLVEVLEREGVAAQTAYALALEIEAGLHPAIERQDDV